MLYAIDADGTAGEIFGRLDIGEASVPVVVLPGAPADASTCRVYGYIEDLNNQPVADVLITFELIGAEPVKSNKVLAGRKVDVRTNASGQIQDASGNAYVDLQRNDQLTPTGTYYRVTAPLLKMKNEKLELEAATYDFAGLVT